MKKMDQLGEWLAHFFSMSSTRKAVAFKPQIFAWLRKVMILDF